ncbi:hypothetical protein FGG08_003913 [Glutinoglossum americanum]|uniref:SprT-like domain-containing protein n=1 Tax=Glutinoglossum americanum TaxID=1670608 RepID=A0A9P8I1P1_9PEZI|nr:hypothetical protein FGG08_003913 [Glutinoglossum americanum]
MLARTLYGIELVERKVYVDRGTKYHISQDEIDILQDKDYKPIYQNKMKVRKARDLALSALNRPLTESQQDAIARLKELRRSDCWEEDVIIKTFNDIDLVLFRGILQDNVFLGWAGGRCMKKCAGVTWAPRLLCRRCAILISVKLLDFSSGLRDLWATLIHEMIHAYFLIECGRIRSRELSNIGDPDHGPCYLDFMRAIRDKMGGYECLPLSVKYHQPNSGYCPSDLAQPSHADSDPHRHHHHSEERKRR